MSNLIAQHGPAKGKKIINGMKFQSISGVIFSQNDESLDSIIGHIKSDNIYNKNNTFLDPQFYYSTFSNDITKKLGEIACFPSDITRRDWRNKDKKILDYLSYHVESTKKISSTLITPGFYIDNIDWHFDYSVDIYNYCVKNYSFENYALSLLINSSFLNNKKNIEELLEEIEDTIEKRDFIYLTICHEKTAENNYEVIDVNSLGNIMSFIYQLKKMGFKFIVGFTFMNSILYAMLNCEFIASGWFNTLRKFQRDKFEITDTFGRRKKRYTSIPLLSFIMFDDLDIMLGTNALTIQEIVSGTDFDKEFINNKNALSFVDLEQEYWQSLQNIFKVLNDLPDIKDRIKCVQALIDHAITLYQKVCYELDNADEQESLRRIKNNFKHLLIWQAAIDLFKDNEIIL